MAMSPYIPMAVWAYRYALEHPEDPNSAEFLYQLHELERRVDDLRLEGLLDGDGS